MDAEHLVKLVDFKILQLNIKTNFNSDNELNVKSTYSVKMAAPQSPDNPTVLLEIQADIGEEKDQLDFSCLANFIFKFDTVPEDWQKAVNECCPEIVHNTIMDRLNKILTNMGLFK